MLSLPPELLDLILSYSDIEVASKFPNLLSKETLSKLTKRYHDQLNTWFYNNNVEYLKLLKRNKSCLKLSDIRYKIQFDAFELISINDIKLFECHPDDEDSELMPYYKQKSIPYDIINLFADEINWQLILSNYPFNSKFLDLHAHRFNKYCWKLLSHTQRLTDDFTAKYIDKLDLYIVVMVKEPSDKFIETYKDRINWLRISEIPNLSKEFIQKYETKLNFAYLNDINNVPEILLRKNMDIIDFPSMRSCVPCCKFNISNEFIYENIENEDFIKTLCVLHYDFSNEFLLKCTEKVGWENIVWYPILTEDFIETYKYKLLPYWRYILREQHLSDKFIEKNRYMISNSFTADEGEWFLWPKILFNHYITETYIEKHLDKIKLRNNCYKDQHLNKLSIKFIEKYIDQIGYDIACEYAILTEDFIKRHQNKVSWYYIDRYQTHLSKEFRDKYREKYYLDF
jgi:hypothetical protein